MQQTLFNGHIQSINYSESDILRDLLHLHVPGNAIDLDPTFSKGDIYADGMIPVPPLRFDINPQVEDCQQADFKKLPLSEKSVDCILLDPPFIISNEKNPGCDMIGRYGVFPSWDELISEYHAALTEMHRVLRNKGVLIFKCQDVLNGGRQYFTHVAVMQMAVDVGFYPIDLMILLRKKRIVDPSKQQRHARKHHCYFWALKKTRKWAPIYK
jgi:hypothetical protein